MAGTSFSATRAMDRMPRRMQSPVRAQRINPAAGRGSGTSARSPEAAVRFAKKGVNLTDEGGLRAGQLFEQAQSTYCCGTEDLQKAVAAYLAMISAKSRK